LGDFKFGGYLPIYLAEEIPNVEGEGHVKILNSKLKIKCQLKAITLARTD
jgi:hypothetical protein